MARRSSKKRARRINRRGKIISLSLAKSIGESLMDLMEKLDASPKKKQMDSDCGSGAGRSHVDTTGQEDANSRKRRINLGKKFFQDFRYFARQGDRTARGGAISFDKAVRWFKKADLLDNRRVTRGDIEVHFIDKLKKDYELKVLPFIRFLKTLCLDRGLRMSTVVFKLCSCRRKKIKSALLCKGKNRTPGTRSRNAPSKPIENPHSEAKITPENDPLKFLPKPEERAHCKEEQNPPLERRTETGCQGLAKNSVLLLDCEATSAEDRVAKWLKDTPLIVDPSLESIEGNELPSMGITDDDDSYLHFEYQSKEPISTKHLNDDDDFDLHPVSFQTNESRAMKELTGYDDYCVPPVSFGVNEWKVSKGAPKPNLAPSRTLAKERNNFTGDDVYLHPVPFQPNEPKVTKDGDKPNLGRASRMVRGKNNLTTRNGAKTFDLASCMVVKGKSLGKEGFARGALRSSNKEANRGRNVTDRPRAYISRSELQRTNPSSKIQQVSQKTGAANFITVEHFDITDDSTDSDCNETRNRKEARKRKPGKKDKAKEPLCLRTVSLGLSGDSREADGNKREAREQKTGKGKTTLSLLNGIAQHAEKLAKQSSDEETSSFDPDFLKCGVCSSSSTISIGDKNNFPWSISGPKTERDRHNAKTENRIKTERMHSLTSNSMAHIARDRIVRAQNSFIPTASAPDNMINHRNIGAKERKYSTENDFEDFVKRRRDAAKRRSPSMSNPKPSPKSAIETGPRNIKMSLKTVRKNGKDRTAFPFEKSKTIESPAEPRLRNGEISTKAQGRNGEDRTSLAMVNATTINSPAETRPRNDQISKKMVGENGEDRTTGRQKSIKYSSNKLQQKAKQNAGKECQNNKLDLKTKKIKDQVENQPKRSKKRTFSNLPASQVKKKVLESRKEKMKAVASGYNSNQQFRMNKSSTKNSRPKAVCWSNRRSGTSVENSKQNFRCLQLINKNTLDKAAGTGCLTEEAQDSEPVKGCLAEKARDRESEKGCMTEKAQGKANKEGCLTEKAQDSETVKACLAEKARDRETEKGCMTQKAQDKANKEGCLTEEAQDPATNKECSSEKVDGTNDTRRLTEKAQDESTEEALKFTQKAQSRADGKGFLFTEKSALRREGICYVSETENALHQRNRSGKDVSGKS